MPVLAQARGAQPLTERDPDIPPPLIRAVSALCVDARAISRAIPTPFAWRAGRRSRRLLSCGWASIDLGNRRVDLLLTHRVRRGACLSRQLGLGELQRFLLAYRLRIDHRRGSARAA